MYGKNFHACQSAFCSFGRAFSGNVQTVTKCNGLVAKYTLMPVAKLIDLDLVPLYLMDGSGGKTSLTLPQKCIVFAT
jgi:hypothetical protein